MGRKKKKKFRSKNVELTKYEKDGLKKLTEIRLETKFMEKIQRLWSRDPSYCQTEERETRK